MTSRPEKLLAAVPEWKWNGTVNRTEIRKGTREGKRRKGLRDACEHNVRDTEEWRKESSEERTRNERTNKRSTGARREPCRVYEKKGKKKRKKKERKGKREEDRNAAWNFSRARESGVICAARGSARVRRHEEEATYVKQRSIALVLTPSVGHTAARSMRAGI